MATSNPAPSGDLRHGVRGLGERVHCGELTVTVPAVRVGGDTAPTRYLVPTIALKSAPASAVAFATLRQVCAYALI